MLRYAFDREEDQLLFQRWVAGPQFSIGFDEFKVQLTPRPVKPDEAVIADAEQILTAFYEGREAHGNI